MVAIGVSAGGLEVLQDLLRALSGSPGFAFVIVQHLDAEHPSALTELLAGATQMPVHTADEGMPLTVDHVYVMPSHADLELAGGALHLVARTTSPSTHLPIDRCLHSLASECGARAIGVVLSGNGRDGAHGLESIKAHGGMTFAQAPASASFPGMPQAAVDSGCVDFVLEPAAIAARLMRLGRHPHLAATPPDDPADAEAAQELALGKIYVLLQNASGIDFSLYRATTVRRRIGRRMALRDLVDVDAYAELLAHDPGELHTLEQDLLIGVTRFFRDDTMFAGLQNLVLPNLLRGRAADDCLRIWVPGCSTGEEALSIAICVHEQMTTTGKVFPIQIYASDVNADSIATARRGIYTPSAAAQVGAERLARYFTPVPGGFRIAQHIRDLCVFTRHNLLQDPPFSHLDLISCRNVLMYLSGVRQSIVQLFHYALKRGGCLIVGAGESSAFDDLFQLVDRSQGFYTRRQLASRSIALPSYGRGQLQRGAPAAPILPTVAASAWDEESLRKRVDRLLLARCSPAALVVTAALEVLEIRGNVGSYLALPEGEVRFDLARLVPEAGLYLLLDRMVTEVCRTGKPARQERALYASGSSMREITLTALPIPGPGPQSVLVLMEIPTVPATAGPELSPTGTVDRASQLLLAQLTDELADAKRRFGALIEEHQNAKIGLAEAAEEALSANEELRSLNEELETAKEELQCTNEELVTVNDELQAKNLELTITRDRALSIVSAIKSPLVVVDSELRVLSANAAFHGTFGTTAATSDGQQLFALGEGLLDFPEVRAVLQRVREGAVLPIFEVRSDVAGSALRTLSIGIRAVGDLGVLLLAVDDVTQQRADAANMDRIAEQLQKSQHIESIGRLAGGIAHDFNNLLTTIGGHTDLLRISLADNADALEMLGAIAGASDRARDLTRQLLAFGRRQILQPHILDLNVIIADLERLLQRCVGESTRYVVEAAPDLWPVRVDPGEIGRVIMNLALNARDAMPNGGTLTIRTSNVTPTAVGARGADRLGRRVELTVMDTGNGIDEATKARMFEPFFSTKDISQGSGLGLSTVLGIVQQSGGTIRCESTPGVGTSFHLSFPAVFGEPIAPATRTPPRQIATRGTETVLLVEDEAEVRHLAAKALTDCGYKVLEASDGKAALALANTHAGRIHLLATDAVMPALGGVDLAEQLRRTRADLRVVFLSGYSPDQRLQDAIDGGANFLQKPYSMQELTEVVRRLLDAPLRQA